MLHQAVFPCICIVVEDIAQIIEFAVKFATNFVDTLFSLCLSIGAAAVIVDKRLVFGTRDEINGKEATRIASSKSSIFALSSSDCLCARS